MCIRSRRGVSQVQAFVQSVLRASTACGMVVLEAGYSALARGTPARPVRQGFDTVSRQPPRSSWVLSAELLRKRDEVQSEIDRTRLGMCMNVKPPSPPTSCASETQASPEISVEPQTLAPSTRTRRACPLYRCPRRSSCGGWRGATAQGLMPLTASQPVIPTFETRQRKAQLEQHGQVPGEGPRLPWTFFRGSSMTETDRSKIEDDDDAWSALSTVVQINGELVLQWAATCMRLP
jgi:hypothetical protein